MILRLILSSRHNHPGLPVASLRSRYRNLDNTPPKTENIFNLWIFFNNNKNGINIFYFMRNKYILVSGSVCTRENNVREWEFSERVRTTVNATHRLLDWIFLFYFYTLCRARRPTTPTLPILTTLQRTALVNKETTYISHTHQYLFDAHSWKIHGTVW